MHIQMVDRLLMKSDTTVSLLLSCYLFDQDIELEIINWPIVSGFTAKAAGGRVTVIWLITWS